ncbi:MAG: prepilin-type N-terminal cleavage/methylation domain-containing protein [Synergistaceae bacterium]|jgi:prepilin-type N-terminal cleavage/methylation domain-containing protein|nr:prepilin-type N-terminal cleavage/methylation domain-containing protein [Synergistaceae bacterium]
MRRRGFSLVELMIALVLGATVGVVVSQTTRNILLLTTRASNNALAWERGQSVLSIIEPRALHAGFGVTYERVGSLFQRSFGGVAGRNDWPPPGGWSDRGPIQVWIGFPSGPQGLWKLAPEVEGVFRGQGLAVLYAVPSALKAKLDGNKPLSMSAGVPATIKLTPSENLDSERMKERLPTTDKRDLRSWVTFPLMEFPVYASLYEKGSLTIRLAEGSGLSATLRPYDEMHYLRGERFQAKNDGLQSEELRTSWTSAEHRVEGVLEMWFQWTPSKSLLEAWVLTTGGEASFGRASRPREWPTEAPWRAEFESRDLAVVRGSWILKNLRI